MNLLAEHIAIYGGSFNPPHLGHLFVASYLVKALGAQEVWFMPVKKHPFRKEIAPFTHRIKMLEQLIDGLESRYQISHLENRPNTSGKTYDLINHIKEKFPLQKFTLVMGSDLWQERHQWYRWSEIKQNIAITLFHRDGFKLSTEQESSLVHPIVFPKISSSKIRENIIKQQSNFGLTTPEIIQYMQENNLYFEHFKQERHHE